MKRHDRRVRSLSILAVAALAITLAACAKEADLTPTDRAYFFMPEDVANLDRGAYRLKTYKSGRDYIFLRSRSSLNGLTASVRRTLIDKGGNEVIFTTQINVQSSEGRARELFTGSHKISSVLRKESVAAVDPGVYGADEVFLAISTSQYYMVLRKARLVYTLNIEGMALSEEQVRNILQKKFTAASKME